MPSRDTNPMDNQFAGRPRPDNPRQTDGPMNRLTDRQTDRPTDLFADGPPRPDNYKTRLVRILETVNDMNDVNPEGSVVREASALSAFHSLDTGKAFNAETADDSQRTQNRGRAAHAPTKLRASTPVSTGRSESSQDADRVPAACRPWRCPPPIACHRR